MAIIAASSTPRTPHSTARVRNIAGTMTSLPTQTTASCFLCVPTPLISKNAPSKNSISGLPALPIMFAADSTAVGSFMPESCTTIPVAMPMMSGFLRTSSSILPALGFVPLNISSVITARTLNIGMTTATRMTTGPRSAPSTSCAASGMPMMTKFER